MEFQKKEKKKTRSEEIRERLADWPESYYRERDPEMRLELLEAADAASLTPKDNRFRRRLYDLRYQKKPGQSGYVDRYVGVWLDFKFMLEGGNGVFRKKGNAKRLRRDLETLGLSAAEAEGEQALALFEREIYHLAMLYMSSCLEDKGYGAVFFGFGKMSDARLAEKIAQDVRGVARTLPRMLGEEEKCEIWTRAISRAYCDMFPDYAALLDE